MSRGGFAPQIMTPILIDRFVNRFLVALTSAAILVDSR